MSEEDCLEGSRCGDWFARKVLTVLVAKVWKVVQAGSMPVREMESI